MKHMIRPAAALALAGVLSCAPRWGRHPSQLQPAGDDEFAVDVSTRPAREPAALPPIADPKKRRPLYYSDLGPDTVDVSNYPTQQKYNYPVYSAVCSRCHTLARSINAPVASRGYWEMYVLGMRSVSRMQGRPITKSERTAILDFLEFDARVRKIEKSRDFEELTEELKRRYAPVLREEIRRLQEQDRPLLKGRP